MSCRRRWTRLATVMLVATAALLVAAAGVGGHVETATAETGQASLQAAGDDATLDVSADFGVTVPAGGRDVTIDVAGPNGTDVSKTVAVGEGTSDLSAVDSTVVVPAEDAGSYEVTVSAAGYDDASATTSVSPGGSTAVDAGTLDARDVALDANVDLAVSAPEGGLDVTYTVVAPDGSEVRERQVGLGAGDGSAPVFFEGVPALDAGEKYTVRIDADGYETDGETARTSVVPGAPATVSLEDIDAEPVELNASADLGVTAPRDDVPVTVQIAVPSGSDVTETVTLDRGERDVSLEAEVPAIGPGETYQVTVSAPGYENATSGTSAPPGGSANVDAGTLAAEDADLGATAELEASAPGDEFPVTFTLVGPDGANVTTATVALREGQSTASVDFGAVDALDASDEYAVRVDADGYETDGLTVTSPGAPGASETADFGALAAEDGELTVDAALGVTAPRDDFAVTVDVATPDGDVVTETATLAEGESEVSVTTAVPAIDADETYDVSVSAEGYDGANATAYVAPSEFGTVDAGTLAGRDVDLTVTGELGVTAPRDDFPATVTVVVPTGENVTETVRLAEGESAASATITVEAVDAVDSYDVSVSAAGYRNASATGTVAPGGEGSVDVGRLGATDVTVDVAGALEVPANESGHEVTVDIAVPGGADASRIVTLEAGQSHLSESFSLMAIDAGETYDVTVSADGYENALASGYAVPDGSTAVDAGVLFAENASVTVDAELAAPPGNESTVALVLFQTEATDSETPVGRLVTVRNATVGADGTAAGPVTLQADFSRDVVGSGEQYAVGAVVVDGNGNYGFDFAEIGTLTPGAEATATDELTLTAAPATVTVNAGLNETYPEDVELTFSLVNGETGTVVATNQSTVEDGDLRSGAVVLPANFTADAGADGGVPYEVTVTPDTAAFDAATLSIGELYPNDDRTVRGEATLPTKAFEVDIRETNAPVRKGDTLEVTVDVENVRSIGATETVTLTGLRGAVVDERTVTLDSEESTTLTLAWETDGDESRSGDVTVGSTTGADSATVRTLNRAPTADAGGNVTVSAGDTVTLNAGGSSDPDGDRLSYSWSLASSPTDTAVTVAGADTRWATVAAPVVDEERVIEMHLTVDDGDGATDSDAVAVTVVPDSGETTTATGTPTATPTATATPTPTETRTPTVTPTVTTTPTETRTTTATPTAVRTPTSTEEPSPTDGQSGPAPPDTRTPAGSGTVEPSGGANPPSAPVPVIGIVALLVVGVLTLGAIRSRT